jgi:hypothetical protein
MFDDSAGTIVSLHGSPHTVVNIVRFQSPTLINNSNGAPRRVACACSYKANWINCSDVIVRPSCTSATASRRRLCCRTGRHFACTTCPSVMRTTLAPCPSPARPTTNRSQLFSIHTEHASDQNTIKLVGRRSIRAVPVLGRHVLAAALSLHVPVLHANALERPSLGVDVDTQGCHDSGKQSHPTRRLFDLFVATLQLVVRIGDAFSVTSHVARHGRAHRSNARSDSGRVRPANATNAQVSSNSFVSL